MLYWQPMEVAGATAGSDPAAAGAPPWTVFAPADGSLPMSPSVLANPGFEAGPPGRADDWADYGLGFEVDESDR